MVIDLIAGARPNFMKIAPIIDAIRVAQKCGEAIKYRLIHTGQHYDKNMSSSFFKQLNIPLPNFNLNAGGGTQAVQTAKIMIEYEKILLKKASMLCLVVGDVTSTMACAIVAKKQNIKVAHVEAGIRSFDLSMPEEINRMVTDSISDYFYTTSEIANKNLIDSGITRDRIIFVGNTMIDTLKKHENYLRKPSFWERQRLKKKNYIVLTLHRPSNVDQMQNLNILVQSITENSSNLKIIFPCHPRTKKQLCKSNYDDSNLFVCEPMSYLEFNYLVKHSKGVITDSGGITEETTYLGIPCITLRDNTERPETINIGTNVLIGANHLKIKPTLHKLLSKQWKKGEIPNLWDGKSGSRIVNHIIEVLKK